MGNASSITEQSSYDKEIDRKLEESFLQYQKIIKLLLLGGAESGKSTFAKQLKIIRLNGFSDEELEFFQSYIYWNVLECLRAVIVGLTVLKIEYVNPDIKQDEKKFTEYAKSCDRNRVSRGIDENIGRVIENIWNDDASQSCYSRRNEITLPDSTKYFLDNVERICTAEYIPTVEDIIRCRIQTTGINELYFKHKEFTFCLIDVGGQKSERRKWLHCFDNVTALFFVIALSEYDKVMAEDPTCNRMHDSIELFKSVSSNQSFINTSVLLFFNKKDIFTEKIADSPLKACFPDYKGRNVFEEASQYIKEAFLAKKPQKKDVYTHFTNATDTQNVDYVFEASLDIVVKKNMSSAGLV